MTSPIKKLRLEKKNCQSYDWNLLKFISIKWRKIVGKDNSSFTRNENIYLTSNFKSLRLSWLVYLTFSKDKRCADWLASMFEPVSVTWSYWTSTSSVCFNFSWNSSYQIFHGTTLIKFLLSQDVWPPNWILLYFYKSLVSL